MRVEEQSLGDRVEEEYFRSMGRLQGRFMPIDIVVSQWDEMDLM